MDRPTPIELTVVSDRATSSRRRRASGRRADNAYAYPSREMVAHGWNFHESERMVCSFRDPNRLRGVPYRIDKSTEIRESHGEPRVRPGGKEPEWRALILSLTGTSFASREQVDGLTVIADREGRLADAVCGLKLHHVVAALGRD